jgi:hypothetical protein
MKKVLTRIVIASISVFLLLVVYVFLTAIGPDGQGIVGKLKTEKGIVTAIREGGVKDISFTIDNEWDCYINRGVEEGLVIADLHKLLYQKQVTVTCYSVWTPLAPFRTKGGHISELSIGDSIIYSQLR